MHPLDRRYVVLLEPTWVENASGAIIGFHADA